MAKRTRIGLNYNYNENWIGGTYYIENLIKALNSLNDIEKPKIIVISSLENYNKLRSTLNYPYLEHCNLIDDRWYLWKAINRISQKIFKSTLFAREVKVDALFPFLQPISFIKTKNPFYWIPDFQEHYLPQFFTQEEIRGRKEMQLGVAESEDNLILSSKDALSNFKEIYPNHRVKTHVLPFAVSLPSIDDIDFNTIKDTYNINTGYFMCPNQFWKHKEHKTLIEAIYYLKKKGKKKVVYLTGKTEDYRFPNYYQELTNLIKAYGLEEQIVSLGFLDRKVQLSIMKNAVAIIQPSIFEGWSSVVEDAKTYGKTILASDIPIHQEQLSNYPNYALFEKQNHVALANLLEKNEVFEPTKELDYSNNIIEFGRNFLEIIKN